MTSSREVTVTGFVTRHQVRQYLRVKGVEWDETDLPGDTIRFTFTASDGEWADIEAFVKKVTQ
ncbi:hypothetical protein [Kribbella sp. NPDC050470]|uniref:hypothetical protein n=1 Tax=unclassified Kribbella TaxID=2644121 RepID=UPI0037896663